MQRLALAELDANPLPILGLSRQRTMWMLLISRPYSWSGPWPKLYRGYGSNCGAQTNWPFTGIVRRR